MSNGQGPKPPYPPHGYPPQPGQPSTTQPGHGSPYAQPHAGHAQPHVGHAQPHPGTAHPPQPGYPAQAGYPQPGYPAQAGSPQPGYPQPGYGQSPQMPPPAPQPAFAPPVMPPPTHPPPVAWVAGQPASPSAPPTVGPPPEAGMFKKSLGRALRLRIEPNEITASEAKALASASPPITEPHLQAFLAWRRSVLFLVAVALIPLTILRFVDAAELPAELQFIGFVPAAAEGFLCLVCWYQLKHWMSWRRQRRALMRAWILFMAAPFLVFLVPMDTIIAKIVESQMGMAGGLADDAGAMAGNMAGAAGVVVALKGAIAVTALLTLAPKAVSLLAGTIRAGIVTKMLFAGASGPGWIVVLATPLYTLFVFTLLIVPYQLTGSGWYLGAMIALAAAQLALGRAGYALAKPTTHDDAVMLVGKARSAYLVSMLVFGVCLLAALGALAQDLGVETIITTALSFETNVLLLTLIGSDLVITSLERARGLSTGTAHLVEETNRQLSAFVGEADAKPATASR